MNLKEVIDSIIIILFMFVLVYLVMIYLDHQIEKSSEKAAKIIARIREEHPVVKKALEGDQESMALFHKALTNIQNRKKKKG